ncbi:MAG: class II myosin [Marteilia pararefringens]
MFERKTVGVEDLSWLREISDKTVTENLRKRFEKDIIYTRVKGSICVCVNPFKDIRGLYSEEAFYRHRDASPIGTPTHLYTFAEQMWSGISNHNNDQAIIFCGESGSGKTVNARHTIEYLRRAATPNKSKESEKKNEILQTFQDLLESFGNARTERNYNSSRFGKILELTINGQNQIVGSRITPIMLEKSRLTNLPMKDRNFHIFYGMMKDKEKYTSDLLQ